MSKGVKLLAALMDDEVGSGEDLLKAARTLAGAVSDLLKAVQPTSGEVRPRKQSASFHTRSLAEMHNPRLKCFGIKNLSN